MELTAKARLSIKGPTQAQLAEMARAKAAAQPKTTEPKREPLSLSKGKDKK